MRFIVMHKVDASMESGASPSKTIVDEMGKLVGGSMQQHRSAKRVRVRHRDGEREVTRGPYAGDDETIAAGYSILELPSKADAMAWANRYGDILVDCEVDVRELV